MRLASIYIGFVVAVSACTADAPGGQGTQACTKALYDPCNDEHDCTSGQCQGFTGGPTPVCTQSCTPGGGTTCPDQGSTAVPCDTTSFCRPAAPNSCTLN
jgi:hypothetical protein